MKIESSQVSREKEIEKLNLKQPPNCIVRSVEESIQQANKISYPLVVRPSYVLGGRAMEIVDEKDELYDFVAAAC